MTSSATRAADLVAVVRIDLRATAAGPHALDPSDVGPDTLTDIQNATVNSHLPGPPAEDGHRRFVNVGRVLVTDDAAAFAGHAACYQHLRLAPTIDKLLCVTVGGLVDPAVIDLPIATTATKVAVVWVGDPRGVGWHLGMTTTTRLAEGGTDPDGTGTLTEIIDALCEYQTFDRVFAAASAMEGNVAAPAVLPVVHWPALDLLRLAEEQVAGGGPPGPAEIAEVLGSDVRQLLKDLWSFGPDVARCERLLAEAEKTVRWLPWIPGLGGRRAWRAVTALGRACAKLGPAGPFWDGVRFPAELAKKLMAPERPVTLRHPVIVLLPLLVLASGAGAGAAYGLSGPGTAPAVADSAGAAVAAVIFITIAYGWWLTVTRRWISGLSLSWARSVLENFASAVADRGVSLLADAAGTWYRDQRRRLVTWWSTARLVVRARLLGEVARLLGLPVPAAEPALHHSQDGADDGDGVAADAATADLAARIASIIAGAARLLGVSALDEDFLQLTAPRQLPLLDAAPHGARLIRFAPAAARQALTEAVAEGLQVKDVAWTDNGNTVGVVRLVPIRPGVVRAPSEATLDVETIVIIAVMHGGDHSMASLIEWLRPDERLDGRISPPERAGGPLTVRLPAAVPSAAFVRDVIDWLPSAGQTAEVTLSRADGRAETATAEEVRDAADQDVDAIVRRIASGLGLP